MTNVILVEDLLNDAGEYRTGIDAKVTNSIPPLMRWLIDSGAVTGIMVGGPQGLLPDYTTLYACLYEKDCGETLIDIAVSVRDELLEMIKEGKRVYLYTTECDPSVLVRSSDTFDAPFSGSLAQSPPRIRIRAAIV